MRTTRIEADERGLFRRGLRGLHGFFHYNKEINLCNLRNPRLKIDYEKALIYFFRTQPYTICNFE